MAAPDRGPLMRRSSCDKESDGCRKPATVTQEIFQKRLLLASQHHAVQVSVAHRQQFEVIAELTP